MSIDVRTRESKIEKLIFWSHLSKFSDDYLNDNLVTFVKDVKIIYLFF